MEKWQFILVEWVNCLKLSNVIKDVQNLQNNEFFSHLLKLLIKEEVPRENTTVILIDFLKKHYTECVFDSDVFLQSGENLTLLCSLLLHYSTVIDSRLALTRPLCETLSERVQVCIRSFLEKVHLKLKKEELQNIIEENVVKYNLKNRNFSLYLSGGDSSPHSSPLHEFLKSPHTSKIMKINEMSREMKKLKSELDLERYEKDELHQELQLQQEKNKKLSEQIAKKSLDISKLRNELSSMECTKPSPYSNTKRKDVERRLKLEITNLELYVSKLQDEQEELQTDRDSINEKLKMMDNQCLFWREKAESTEKTNNELSEQLFQKEKCFINLQQNCNELTALLEELRSSKLNNDIEIDTLNDSRERLRSNIDVGENLASTVIEVQLRDFQRENQEIKSLLKMNQEQNLILNGSLDTLKSKFEGLTNSYEEIQLERNELAIKVEILIETQNNLEETKQKLMSSEKKVAELQYETSTIATEITQVKSEMTNLKTKLEEYQNVNSTLTVELATLHMNHDNIQKTLQTKEQICVNLQLVATEVQAKYDNLLEGYKNTSFELQSATTNFKEIDVKLETQLKNLENLVFGKNDNNLNYDEKWAVLEKIITRVENDKTTFSAEKATFNESILEFQELVALLEAEKIRLTDRETINLQEISYLNDNLKSSNNEIAILKANIDEYGNRIIHFEQIISEMSTTIDELEKLKVVISDREETISEVKLSNHSLQSDLEQYKGNNQKLEAILNDLQQQKYSLETQLSDSDSEISIHKANVVRLQKTIEDLESAKITLENELITAKKEMREKKLSEAELNKVIADLRSIQVTVEDELTLKKEEIFRHQMNENKLQQILSDLRSEKYIVTQQLDEARESILKQKIEEEIIRKESSERINSLNMEINVHSNKISLLTVALEKSEKECIFFNEEITKNKEIRQEEQMRFEALKLELDKKILLLTETMENVERDLQTANKEKKEIIKTLSKKTVVCEELQINFDVNLKEYDVLQCKIEKMVNKLNVKEEETSEKDNIISENNQEILKLKLEIEKQVEEIVKLKLIIEKLNSEIVTQKSEIDKANALNGKLENRAAQLEKEISLMESCKSYLEAKSIDLEVNLNKIISEVSAKNIELNKIIEKRKELQEKTVTEIEQLKAALTENKHKIDELSEDRNIATTEHEMQMEMQQAEILKLSDEINFLKSKEIENIQQLRATKDELSEIINKYTESLVNHQGSVVEYETQIVNLTENLHEMVQKYNVIDKNHADLKLDFQSNDEKLHISETKCAALESFLCEERSINQKYLGNINELNLELQRTKNDCISFDDDLRVLRNKLDASNNKNISLHEQLSVNKTSHENLKNDYDSLKGIYSNAIAKNEERVKMLRSELHNSACSVCNMQQKFEELQQTITKSREEKDELIQKYELKITEKDEAQFSLEKQNEVLQINIAKLNKNQESLKMQLLTLQTQNAETQNESELTNSNIAKLQCAYNILQTGKENLEKDFTIVTEKLQKLSVLKEHDKQKFCEELQMKNQKIQNFDKLTQDLQTEIHNSESKIEKLMIELSSLNDSLESLKTQNEMLNVNLVEERKKFQEKLQLAKTTNVSETEAREVLLTNLKTQHSTLEAEVQTLRVINADRLKELNLCFTEKELLQKEITVQQQQIVELNNSTALQSSKINKLQFELRETQTVLQDHMNKLVMVSNEKAYCENRYELLVSELASTRRKRDEILNNQARMMEETENNLIRAHGNAIEVKKDLLKRVEIAEADKKYEKELRVEIEELLEEEKKSKRALESRLCDLQNEKLHIESLYRNLQEGLCKLSSILNEKGMETSAHDIVLDSIDSLNINISHIEKTVIMILQKKQQLISDVTKFKEERVEINEKIQQMISEKEKLNQEKDRLMKDYNLLIDERTKLIEKEKDLSGLLLEREALRIKLDECMDFEKNHTKDMQSLMEYKKFVAVSKNVKMEIDKLMNEKYKLENCYSELQKKGFLLEHKTINLANDHKIVGNQQDAMKSLTENIQKQYNEVTANINNFILHYLNISDDIVTGIFTEKSVDWQNCFENLQIKNQLEKVIDCKNLIGNAMNQIKLLGSANETIKQEKNVKLQKENVLRNSTAKSNIEIKVKEEEFKKKNIALMQRLTLADHSKANLEKKIKLLHEENQKLSDKINSTNKDKEYMNLLQKYLKLKEAHDKVLKDHEVPQKETHNFDKIKCERDVEMGGLREAYSKILGEVSQLQLETGTIRNVLNERNNQVRELTLIKEAYEKLLEDNTKLMTELDTLKYKRNRDREEYCRLLKKERDEGQTKDNKLTDIRREYEGKLEKMKERMLSLYRLEVDHERQRLLLEKNDNTFLNAKNEQMKNDTRNLRLQLKEVQLENNKLSEELKRYKPSPPDSFYLQKSNNNIHVKRELTTNSDTDLQRNGRQEGRYATLPRAHGLGIIDEMPPPKHANSFPLKINQEFQMEDEESDLFSNKCLLDLEEGRCIVPSINDSRASRFSELKWRNSLCPPHLKSSYPAETQFISPSQIKDEELKVGVVEFDDSLSTKLLPVEKRKKDFGTTSYKKPGPPTPSKNGGRVSLQGNEVLRENLDLKTPKRTTPSRLKSLFMGRNSSVKENSENQLATPKTKRLSIFRKGH